MGSYETVRTELPWDVLDTKLERPPQLPDTDVQLSENSLPVVEVFEGNQPRCERWQKLCAIALLQNGVYNSIACTLHLHL